MRSRSGPKSHGQGHHANGDNDAIFLGRATQSPTGRRLRGRQGKKIMTRGAHGAQHTWFYTQRPSGATLGNKVFRRERIGDVSSAPIEPFTGRKERQQDKGPPNRDAQEANRTTEAMIVATMEALPIGTGRKVMEWTGGVADEDPQAEGGWATDNSTGKLRSLTPAVLHP